MVVALVGIGKMAVTDDGIFSDDKELHSGRLVAMVGHFNIKPEELKFRLSEEVKGKLFDKQGREYKYLTGKDTEVFDKDGNPVKNIRENEKGEIVFAKPDKREDYMIIEYKSLEEVEKILTFKPYAIEGLPIEK